MSKLMRASTVVYMAIVVFFWGYLSVVVFEVFRNILDQGRQHLWTE